MEKSVILEMIDGRKVEAELTAVFRPQTNQIQVVLTADNTRQTLALEEICCVMMVPPAQLSLNGQKAESVLTYGGNIYRVSAVGKRRYQTGFFGYAIDHDSIHRLIFFTTAGVKNRKQELRVGKILEEKGMVTARELQDAITEQKKLRTRPVGEIISAKTKLPQAVIDRTIEKARRQDNKYSALKTKKPVRVGDILIEAGIITQEQIDDALATQENGKKKKIGEILIDHGLIDENQLLSALAAKFHLPFVELSDTEPTHEALISLSPELVEQMQVFPIEISDNHLVVATSEPANAAIDDALRFHTSLRVKMVVAPAAQIEAAIARHYTPADQPVHDLIGSMTEEDVGLEEEEDEDEISLDESDSHIISLVNNILIDAYKQDASDIHFETGLDRKPTLVRYRIDGICSAAHNIPPSFKVAVISRIKIIAGLDIAERRRPQSGKIALRYKKKKIEYRVEITPTFGNNEDAVLRILASSKPMPVEEMGFSATNSDHFKQLLAKPYGIILCVGPTGSGKTTTLHSALGAINRPDRKIWTAEDPVEITQEGLRQVQVQPKIGFTFQEALRSFLRADPDVVMIGEMRDSETAKIGIEASLTGHLVFSTLHTNSAAETISRLIEMGLDPFNFADALLGILAQRLARRLCGNCKKSYHPESSEYDEIRGLYGQKWFDSHGLPAYSEDTRLDRAGDCQVCNHSGYKGRVAIHELLVGSENIKKAIKQEKFADEIADMAIAEGMATLKMDGIQKVLEGDTDITEVMRVCI